MSVTPFESLDTFLRMLEHELVAKPEDLTGSTPLLTGEVLDSLDVMDIIMIVEDLGAEVDEDDVMGLLTLADFYEYARARLPG